VQCSTAKATTGADAWPLVESDINWALKQAPLKGKKILLDEVCHCYSFCFQKFGI
jgi:hypothetical protein